MLKRNKYSKYWIKAYIFFCIIGFPSKYILAQQPSIVSVSPNPVCIGDDLIIEYADSDGEVNDIRFVNALGTEVQKITTGLVIDQVNMTITYTIPNRGFVTLVAGVQVNVGNQISAPTPLTICNTNIERVEPEKPCQASEVDIFATFDADPTAGGVAIRFEDAAQLVTDFSRIVIPSNIVVEDIATGLWKITVEVPSTESGALRIRGAASISVLSPFAIDNSGATPDTTFTDLGAYSATICAETPVITKITDPLNPLPDSITAICRGATIEIHGIDFRNPGNMEVIFPGGISIPINNLCSAGGLLPCLTEAVAGMPERTIEILVPDNAQYGVGNLEVISLAGLPEESPSRLYPVTICPPQPVISNITCSNGRLTITGTNLALQNSDITQVIFTSGGTLFTQAAASQSSNQLTVDVPSGISDPNVKIEVAVLKDQEGESISEAFPADSDDPQFFDLSSCSFLTPSIDRVNSDKRLCIGQQTAEIHGTNFTTNSIVILNNDTLEVDASQSSSTKLVVIIPNDPSLVGGSATITVSNGEFLGTEFKDNIADIVISSSISATLVGDPVTCNENDNFSDPNLDSDGGVLVSNFTGISPYQYSVNNGAFTSMPPSLSKGSYNIVLKDVDNCETPSQSITISEPAPLSVTISAPSIPPGGCALGESATISAIPSIEPNATDQFSYTWSINNTDIASTQSVELQEGNNVYKVEFNLNGCLASRTSPQINGASSVVISGLKPTYCLGDNHNKVGLSPTEGDIFFYNFQNRVSLTFDEVPLDSLEISTKLSGPVEVLNDALGFSGFELPPGRYYISYRKDLGESEGIPCPQVVASTFWVGEKPIVEIDRTNLDLTYCQRFEQIALERTMNSDPLSDFLGPGVVNTDIVSNTFEFIPLLAPADTNEVILTYTDSLGCSNSDTVELVVFSEPSVEFIQYDSTSLTQDTVFCVGDTIIFEDISGNPINLLASRDWSYGDGERNNDKDNNQTVSHIYENAGVFTVILDKVNSDEIGGCDNRNDKQIIIGDRPQVGFRWENVCLGDSIKFFDLTRMDSIIYPKWDASLQRVIEVKDSIVSWNWDFGDGAASDRKNPTHKFEEAGMKFISVEVVTSLGCSVIGYDTLNILSSIVVDETNDYVETFDTATTWVPEVTDPLWQWTSSDSLGMTQDQLAWITVADSVLGYNIGDTSALFSPCFDLTGLSRPKIELTIYVDTDLRRDGVQLQYSKTGLEEWIPLGEITSNGVSTGIQWYNRNGEEPSIGSIEPGLFGWSGPDSIWEESAIDGIWNLAIHRLDVTEGTIPVKFRLLFSSSGEGLNRAEGFNGFALDRVRIANRKKSILYEHFTNSDDAINSKPPLLDTDQELDSNGRGDIVHIQYKVGFPNGFETGEYREGPMARSLYYGVSIPDVAIINGNSFQSIDNDLRQNNLDFAMLPDPSFYIDEVTQNGNSIDIKITARNTFDQSQEMMMLAAVVDGTNGLNRVVNMIPDPAGLPIIIDENNIWNKDKQKTFTIPWTCGSGNDLVVFLQDYVTKEVYQAAFFPNGVVCRTGRDPELEPQNIIPSLSIYPNPTNSQFTLDFNTSLEESGRWEIFNAIGQRVGGGLIETGMQKLRVGQPNWASGVYVLKVKVGSLINEQRKVMIRRD